MNKDEIVKDEENDKIFGKALPQMIHDIRNPLNIIIGFSSILQIDESIDEEIKSYAKKIYNSGMLIEQLLANIDYFLIEEYEVSNEIISLKEQVENFLEEKKYTIKDKQIYYNFEVVGSDEIFYSADIISRLLNNLFQFSLKGFKSSRAREINLIINNIDKECLEICYYDSSQHLVIKGEYFTFEEVLKAKRSLSPLFIKRIADNSRGEVFYYFNRGWTTKMEELHIQSDSNHGYILRLPKINNLDK